MFMISTLVLAEASMVLHNRGETSSSTNAAGLVVPILSQRFTNTTAIREIPVPYQNKDLNTGEVIWLKIPDLPPPQLAEDAHQKSASPVLVSEPEGPWRLRDAIGRHHVSAICLKAT